MTAAQLDELLAGIAGATKKYTADFVAKQLAPLLKRIEQLESRPSIDHQGVHVNGRHYPRGAAVTRQGCLWIAKHDTILTPGTPEGASDWQMAVKAGRDRTR
jgi:hypothetical protein